MLASVVPRGALVVLAPLLAKPVVGLLLAVALVLVGQGLAHEPLLEPERWGHLARSLPLWLVNWSLVPLATGIAVTLAPMPSLRPLHALPAPLDVAVGVLLCDGCVYVAHRLQHELGPLWRFHEVHHVDPDPDVGTAWQRHPVSAVVEAWLVAFPSALLAVPPASWAIYVALQTPNALLQHGRGCPSPAVERLLRLALVTPALHRLHHAADAGCQRSNYAFLFTFWDRLFGTYRADPPGTPRACGVEGGPRELPSAATLLMRPWRHREDAATTSALTFALTLVLSAGAVAALL